MVFTPLSGLNKTGGKCTPLSGLNKTGGKCTPLSGLNETGGKCGVYPFIWAEQDRR